MDCCVNTDRMIDTTEGPDFVVHRYGANVRREASITESGHSQLYQLVHHEVPRGCAVG